MTARSDGKTIFITNASYKRLKKTANRTGRTLKEVVDLATKHGQLDSIR